MRRLAWWVVGVYLALGLTLGAALALRPAQPAAVLMTTAAGAGTRLHDLTRGMTRTVLAASANFPVWSPDGDWVAYYAQEQDAAGGTWWYWARSLVTGQQVRLGLTEIFLPPVWSPDGRWLITYDVALSGGYSLRYSRREGMTMSPSQFLAFGRGVPLWSPDGADLYSLDAGFLYRVEAACFTEGRGDCTLERRARVDETVTSLVGWSPSGALLVTRSAPGSAFSAVATLDVTTGVAQTVYRDVVPGTAPAWSADGRLAVSRGERDPALADPVVTGVYVSDAADDRLLYFGLAGALTWSPDAPLLAFEAVDRVSGLRSVAVYDGQLVADRTVTLALTGTNVVSPQWGRYRGLTFESGGWVLAHAALGLVWALAGRRLSAARGRGLAPAAAP